MRYTAGWLSACPQPHTLNTLADGQHLMTCFGQWAMSRSDVCNFRWKALKSQIQWVTSQLSPVPLQQLHTICTETKGPQHGNSQDVWGAARSLPRRYRAPTTLWIRYHFIQLICFCSISKLISQHIKSFFFSFLARKSSFWHVQIVEFMTRIIIIRNNVKDKEKKKTRTEKVPWIKFVISAASQNKSLMPYNN